MKLVSHFERRRGIGSAKAWGVYGLFGGERLCMVWIGYVNLELNKL